MGSRYVGTIFVYPLLLLAALFIACSSPPVDPSAPEALESRRTLDRLAIGDVEYVASHLSADLRRPDALAKVQQMAAQFPRGTARGVNLIAFDQQRLSNAEGVRRTTQVSFESEYEGGNHLLTQFLWRGSDRLELVGMQVQPLPDSLQHLNRFTLRGKGAGHYIFLTGMLAVPSTMAYALYVWLAIRSRLRARWVWLGAIAVGVCSLRINWTTGALFFQPLRFQLFGLGALQQPYGPWMLFCSVPLGALLFLLLRRRFTTRRDAAPVDQPPAPDEAVAGEPSGPPT